jgi:hypothetical protein
LHALRKAADDVNRRFALVFGHLCVNCHRIGLRLAHAQG